MYSDENGSGLLPSKLFKSLKSTTLAPPVIAPPKSRTALTDISNRNPPPSLNPAVKKPAPTRIPQASRPLPPTPNPDAMDTEEVVVSVIPPRDLTAADLKRASSPPLNFILPPDAMYRGNAQYNVPYLTSILQHLHSSELKKQPSPSYMSRQSDLTPRMREILIDWLIEVHIKFKLESETLYLCVNLIDRFLERRAVMRSKLQLVGCTALWLAAKYEEVFAPEVMDFVHISDKTYTKEQLIQMEGIMLTALHFNLTTPSAYRFLQRYCMLAFSLHGWGEGGVLGGAGGAGSTFQWMCEYLLELTLQEYRFLGFLPSVVAAACCYIGCTSMGVEVGEELQGYIGYRYAGAGVGGVAPGTQGGVVECMTEVMGLVNGESKYRAVRKKYADTKFDEVSKIQIRSPLD